MKLPTLLSLLCVATLAAAPPEWDRALQEARKALAKEPGAAAVVLLERTDPQTVQIQFQTFGTRVRKAHFRARAEGRTLPALSMESAEGMEGLRGSSVLNEQFTEMEVSLEGEGFQPRLLLRIPRTGEKAEVGTLLVRTPPRQP